MNQPADTSLQIVVRESAAAQWFLHLVKHRKPLHHVPEDHGHLLASRANCQPKKFQTAPSAGKQMATVFWDMVGIQMVEWFPLFDKMKEPLHGS
jgi:hypothetical protein